MTIANRPDGAIKLPLASVRVLDFSTLLPGPLASLLLAEADSDVVKVEGRAGKTCAKAATDPAFEARGVLARPVSDAGRLITALPVSLDRSLRRDDRVLGYARLGDTNQDTPWAKGNDP